MFIIYQEALCSSSIRAILLTMCSRTLTHFWLSKIFMMKGKEQHLPDSSVEIAGAVLLQLIKATVLAESSYSIYFRDLSAPVMSTDVSQVGFALFPSFWIPIFVKVFNNALIVSDSCHKHNKQLMKKYSSLFTIIMPSHQKSTRHIFMLQNASRSKSYNNHIISKSNVFQQHSKSVAFYWMFHNTNSNSNKIKAQC